MRICMLSWEYPPRIVGGIARHVEELSEALAAQGHEVVVFTADHPETPAEEVRNGVQIVRVRGDHAPTPDFLTWVLHLNFGMAERALRWHHGQPFDLVHSHDWLVAQAGVLLKKGLDLPLLATIHATEAGRMHGIHTPIQRYIHQQEWFLTYEAWRVIVCSHYMHHEVRRLFNLPEDKLDVIPNGIEYRKFDFEFDRMPFRRRFALDHEKLVMFVGRMVPEKGAQVLIEAAPTVLAQFPDAKFVVVGRGGFQEELRHRVAQLGLGSKVMFPGYVDDDTLLRIYKSADCAVFPSLYEPFGIVALEGMAARLPTVVSDAGGLAEIVEHQVSGITTYTGNADSLAWGILEVLRNPEHAHQMGQAAFRRVEEVFNWPAIARQTGQVYARIQQESGRAATSTRPVAVAQ